MFSYVPPTTTPVQRSSAAAEVPAPLAGFDPSVRASSGSTASEHARGEDDGNGAPVGPDRGVLGNLIAGTISLGSASE